MYTICVSGDDDVGVVGLDISLLRISFTIFFFFQAEDGIRDLVRSRGLGDVYKRQHIRTGSF